MKQSKVKEASRAGGTEPDKPKSDNKKAVAAQPKKNRDKLSRLEKLKAFQTLEWHVITIAGAEMDEAAKADRLTAMLAELNELGDSLKETSRKSFGISAETINLRLDLTARLVSQILKSGKRWALNKTLLDSKPAKQAMNKYEASEWQLLEQGRKAKDAARSQNSKKQEAEQVNLFKFAERYYGASCDLAANSEKVGIPQEVVHLRSKQRLSEMGNDPDLKEMRNPSPDGQVLTGGAAFVAYVKELIEKLAKAIKSLVRPSEKQPSDTGTQPEGEPAPVRPN
jgi:uncharacterized protein YaaR (DUF327 family)